MPLSYCSCVVKGREVHMELDLTRLGKYVCMGCGATEEVVQATQLAMQEQWIKDGIGFGQIPEVYQIDGDPLNLTPYKEPSIEFWKSERSLKEIEQLQKEMNEP